MQDEHNQDSILGYGVLSHDGMYGVLSPDGVVLEFAIDPKLSRRRRGQIASRLIMALEERSRARGDDMIQFNLPSADEPIRRALRSAGYYEQQWELFMVAIVDLPGLLTRLLSNRKECIPEGWSPTFILELKPGHYRFCPHRRLRIELWPEVVVSPHTEAPADYTVDTDLSTLTELIFRRASFEQATTASRLAVRPVSGVRDVRTLMRLLAVRSPCYMPYADIW